jgi:hypothetical protein
MVTIGNDGNDGNDSDEVRCGTRAPPDGAPTRVSRLLAPADFAAVGAIAGA